MKKITNTALATLVSVLATGCSNMKPVEVCADIGALWGAVDIEVCGDVGDGEFKPEVRDAVD